MELGLVEDRATFHSSPLARAGNRALRLGPARVRGYAVARLPSTQPQRDVHELWDRGLPVSDLSEGPIWARGYFQYPEAFSDERVTIGSIVREALEAHSQTRPSTPHGRYAVMHVRRGDYVTVARNLDRLGACTLQYFLRASANLDPDLPIVVVSDDPNWCQSVLVPSLNRDAKVYVSGSDLTDLRIISKAVEVVLSNSTFSWWGAFCGNASKIVTPTPWFDAPDAGGETLSAIGTLTLNKSSGERA